MKKEQKKFLLYAVLVIIGIIIGYFLFSGNNLPLNPNNNTNNSCTNTNVTTTTPTTEGNKICTKVCIDKPKDCPRTCPPGTHWQCSGTLAMNCGCFPDNSTTTTTTIPTCPTGQYYDTGRETCLMVMS